MLDLVNSEMTAQQSVANQPVPTANSSKCSSSTIYVWLRWDAESIALVRAVQDASQLESFRLVDIQRTASDPNVWRCRFEQAEVAPDLEQRTLALLSRISSIGRWVRAERIYQRSAAVSEEPDEYLWEAFARRPLP